MINTSQTHDLKKNKTKLFFKRGNKALTEIFKKYFGGNYNTFLFNIIVDYNSKQIYTNYPSTNYSESFDSQLKKINFQFRRMNTPFIHHS